MEVWKVSQAGLRMGGRRSRGNCLLKPLVKEITIPTDLKLHSDMRAIERVEFDHQVVEKMSLFEQYKMERERLLKETPMKRVSSSQNSSMREEEIKPLISNITKQCSSSSSTSTSSTLNLSEMLVTLTNDVICRVALGTK
ncbi:hypothetical protein DVH24_004329 [Malus domestica]|uniref:TPX2 C-terminal domain-containing protein n=1 Tax=Malus domestica TaxID=3750 RepID=A0A498K8R9_MALDO|nr:hypothetical protein DVH24_004329 [Malus domestica]